MTSKAALRRAQEFESAKRGRSRRSKLFIICAVLAGIVGVVFLALAFVSSMNVLPSLPQAEADWRTVREDAARISVRVPRAWRVVSASALPSAQEIADLKAKGDVMGTYLETMTKAVNGRLYVIQAVDPTTVSTQIPFATSMYAAYIVGVGSDKTPDELLEQNVSATKSLYKLPANARLGVKEFTPPSDFERAWQLEYTWTATKDDTGQQADLAGSHYLLVRGNDAWIIGFTSMLANARPALPTWQMIVGSAQVR